MKIGNKLKRLRQEKLLTQNELADRCDLSKGFISQLERDLTSPSLSTLDDILEALGTNIKDFFNDHEQEKIVFGQDDIYEIENEELEYILKWLIPNAQKNKMEPILLILKEGGKYKLETAHEGEEFGYVLSGTVHIHLGSKKYKAKKCESFYYNANVDHYISNHGKKEATILWVATPPSF